MSPAAVKLLFLANMLLYVLYIMINQKNAGMKSLSLCTVVGDTFTKASSLAI